MKRPWLLILTACVLGELYGLKFAWKGTVVLLIILLILFLIHYKFKKLSKNNFKYIIIFSTVFTLSFLRINIENYLYLNNPQALYIEKLMTNKAVDKRNNNSEITLEGSVSHISQKGEKLRLTMGCVIIYADVAAAKEIKIGNGIRVSGRIKTVKPASNPGEFDTEYYYRALGIRFFISAKKLSLVKHGYNLPLQFLYNLRAGTTEALIKIFNQDTSAFAAAALLGEKNLLDEDIYELYRKNGIAHLLAISGLHAAIFGVALYTLLRKKAKLGFTASALISGVVLIIYAIFTGASISVVRAVAMLLIAFTAEIIGRTYDLVSAAGLAAYALLMYSPYNLFNSGFLLSFSAVLALGMAAAPIIKKYKIKNKILTALITGILLQISTLPLITYFFYSFSLYGFIINLIVIPLMGIFLCSSLIALLTSFLFPPLAAIIAYIPEGIVGFYTNLCEAFSRLPYYSVLTGRPSAAQILIYYSLLILVLYIILNVKSKIQKTNILRYDAGFIRHLYDKIKLKKVDFYPVCISVILLLPLILLKLPSFYTEIYFIDVGQGDGIYMKTAGEDILIDSGSTTNKEFGRRTLKPFLQCMAVDSIEKVFITHADIDHTSGILYLLEEDKEIKIKELYLPCPAEHDSKYDRIRQAAKFKNTEIKYASKGDKIGEFLCVSPCNNCEIKDVNEQSIVLLYQENNFKALFTGDAGKISEERILADAELSESIKDMSLLKVGHHGSFTASGEDFIKAMKPVAGILSYGENNRYGHPHKEVVYLLKKYKVKTYATSDCGQIKVRIKNNRIDISTFLKSGRKE